MEANNSGRVSKRGKLKVWTGEVPPTPIAEAVEPSRHYNRRKKAIQIVTRNLCGV